MTVVCPFQLKYSSPILIVYYWFWILFHSNSILYCQNENIIFLLDLLQADHVLCGKSLGENNNNYYLSKYWQLKAISSLSVSNLCTSVKVSGLTKEIKFSWSHKVGWYMHWGICSEVFVHRGIAVDSRGFCLLGIKQGPIFIAFMYHFSFIQWLKTRESSWAPQMVFK